ncbi:unnamed protein product [Macrosiphum euphorbiae]|uniref:Uncharacterized protein n=1 Tax=Macrosiphum euphorbiae TaxID=13131 RepID=A0AAV0XW71_9HEMI|nr:unnamed protein product [Macrosiphum euphorbiae]
MRVHSTGPGTATSHKRVHRLSSRIAGGHVGSADRHGRAPASGPPALPSSATWVERWWSECFVCRGPGAVPVGRNEGALYGSGDRMGLHRSSAMRFAYG